MSHRASPLALLFIACLQPADSLAPAPLASVRVERTATAAATWVGREPGPQGIPDGGPWKPCAWEPPGDGTCDGDWCWVAPRPHGHWLNAVVALAPDDVWAAGDYGVVQHFDGQGWSYAYVEGHPNLYAIWADASGDAWVAGDDGVVARRSGSGWSKATVGTLPWRALAGARSDELWLAGLGFTAHWDGRQWTSLPLPAAGELVALWLAGPADVWAVSGSGLVLRKIGAAPWTTVTQLPNHYFSTSLWGTGPTDVWVGGSDPTWMDGFQHFDGTSWSPVPLPYGHVLAMRDGWAYVERAQALELHHLVGGQWTLIESKPLGVWEGIVRPASLSVLPGDEVWVTTQAGMVMHRTPGRFDAAVPVVSTLSAVWAGGDDVLAAGVDTLLYRHAGAWTCLETPVLTRFGKIWGSGPRDLWAVGQTWNHASAWHFDGEHWVEHPLSQDIPAPYAQLAWGVDGVAANDVWAVGSRGLVRHWDGESWSELDAGVTQHLFAVAAVAPDDVWAVGERGLSIHWDGARWSSWSTGAQQDLRGLVAFGPDDVWAAGFDGVRRWDGVAWQGSAPLPPLALPGFIGGTSSADLWVSGGVWQHPRLYRGDGSSWREVPAGTSELRLGLAFTADGGVWSAGYNGTLLRVQQSL